MELGTPVKVKQEPLSDSSTSPTVSRYGRSHKPKMQEDFVSTDKKVSAYLKISPGNRIQNFGGQKEMKKKTSPKKVNSYLGSSPRRGRPPKSPNEDATAASVVNLKVSDKNSGPILQAMKLEPQDPDTPVDGCDWMVGDLAWARVGGHPFWPCIVALDPIQKIFTKTVVKGRGNVSQRLIHVQFFGDNGRRSWLNITSVMSYNGREAFVQLGETILAGMRKKEPKQTAAFVIKPAVIQVWEKAVQEAEDLANASREDRVAFFALHFPPPQPIITKEVVLEQLGSPLAALLSSPKKRGRKRKTEGTPAEIDNKQKQVKLETEKSLEEEAKKIEEVDPLSTTPRTIADRKKRQALLMQLARNSSVSPGETHSVESSAAGSPATPSFTSTPNISRSEGATTAEIKQTPLKRPANPEPVESVETKKPRKKYEKKKKNYSFKAFSDFKFDRLADEHPELAEDDILKYLKKEWKKLSDLEKERFTSKKGLTEKGSTDDSDDSADDVDMEEASSEEVEEAQSCKSGSPAPPSLTASTQSSQKTPTAKRNHSKSLFSGIKAEKVCLICEKAGDTVRCRGPCQGFYHPICVNSPPSLTPDQPTPTMGKRKKGRPKKSLGNTSLLSSATGVNLSSQSSSGSQLSEDVSQTVTESQAENVESAPPSERTNGKDEVKETDTIGDSVEKEKEIIEKEDIKKNRPVVEVIEPSTKVRKSSKDSKDKDSDSNSNSGSNSGEEGEGFRCKECQEGVSQPCFVCHEYVHKKSGEAKLYRCCTAYCGKLYHEECLKKWPQCSWRTNNGNGKNCERVTVICPQHTCHTCASDNPSVIKARYSNDKLVRCIRCPTTYHYGNYCIPAGSEILTNTQIICPQHYKPAKKITQHVNAAWCFICASGGSLICCDLCPTAFHADCLNISTPPDGSYVCEDCQTGRFPLYGEIVWVKLGTYRWWPAEILYPALIPDNIQNLPHVRGEFCVKFFGSHDHYWVNRGRVFLYQDGDTAGKNYNGRKSSVDNVFVKAAKEASEAQQKYLEDKATRDAETRPGMKPPNYVKLKTNKPVGNVRTVEMNLSSLTPCECDPKKDNPCAPESDCLNRILMVECHPQVCPAGEKCCNQLFEKRLYPSLQPYHTQGRGWGLKTLVPLKKGDFVIEYVGEIINEEEYKKRMIQMHENNEENFYFLTIDKDRMLDAGPKGNVARFMNHSCQPNCETQKWTVSGDTRVGLFALCDIPANTELVFNYNLESIGTDKKPCMCGAPNCSGFIGVKANKNPDREKDDNKEKKSVKRKKSLVPAKTLETECFVCRKPGDLLPCDGKYCTKVYHLACLNKKQRPQGYWLCPWHQCNICNKGRVQRCTLCINSFCQEHSKGNIRIDDARGAVCLTHDQKKNVTVDEKTKSKDSAEGKQCLIKVDSDNIEISSVSQKQPPEKSGKISKVDAANVENSVSIKKVDVVSIENPVTVKKVELINNNIIKTENVNSPSRRTRRSQSSAETGIHCSVERVSKRRSRPSSVDEKLIGAFKKTESNNSKKVNLSFKTLDQKYFAELLDEVVDNLPLRDAVVEDPSVHSENSKEECTSKEFDHEEPSAIEENAYKRSEVHKINGKIKEEEDGNSLDKDNSIEFSASAKSLVSSCDCDAIGQDLDHKTGQRSINSLNCCSQEEISQTESVELNFKLEDSLNQESSETESNVEATEQESKPVESSEEKDETSSQKIVKNIMSENDKTEESERISAPNTEKKSETSEETAKKLYVVADLKDDEIKENGPNISTKDLENDFELSYSDCSNDKIFQNVNNSESSIELKVTNCTNTKTVQKTEDLGKVESKSDLHNGLENHNPMEVA